MIGLENYLLFAINLDFCVLVLHSAQVKRFSFSCMWYCFFFKTDYFYVFKNLKKAIKHSLVSISTNSYTVNTPIKYNVEFLNKCLETPNAGFQDPSDWTIRSDHSIGPSDRIIRSYHPIGSSDRTIRSDHPKGFSSVNPPLCQLSL